MFRPIRLDHTNCLQVAIKTHSFSIGEGGICVSNTNGNIENDDYIQSSDLLGYGEKQDDDLLHNYTIAKATIDCNFELDSPYYQCHEIENGVRVAFIACTYHCG